MKIKNICARTGLTDRTVRFYMEKGLLAPESYEQNGRTYYDFDEQDVMDLQAIISLRRAGFSVKDIYTMQKQPGKITEIIADHKNNLQGEVAGYQKILEKLDLLLNSAKADNGAKTYQQVAGVLEEMLPQQSGQSGTLINHMFLAEELKPNFGKFDEETQEEKEAEYRRFLGHQYLREQNEKKWRWFAPMADFFQKTAGKLLAAGILIFLIWFIVISIPRRVGNLWNLKEQYAICMTTMNETMNETMEPVFERAWGRETFTSDMEEYSRICDILNSTWYFGSFASIPRRAAQIQGIGQQIQLSVWTDERTVDDVDILITESGYFWVHKNGWYYRYFLGLDGTQDYEKLCDELAKICKGLN